LNGDHGTIFCTVPRDTRDDGFHEIQLNGKQLVFLFMAATVVSVVIFLCGVLVGRGAGTGTPTVAEAPPLTDELVDDSISRPPAVGTADASEADVAVSTGAEELDYFTRLEGEPSDDELLLRPAPGSAPAAPATEASVVARPTTEQPSRLSAASPAPPVSAGAESRAAARPAGDWAVQVAALNDSADADVVARRWGQKGYQAYVVTPSDGTPAVFRVRIGAFKTRREADALASKLQQEERISPWVTR